MSPKQNPPSASPRPGERAVPESVPGDCSGSRGLNSQSRADEKIRCFRSLFRGREDVYARRFESRKSGRSGYSPVCGNEWVRGVCDKPRTRCADCLHKAWTPVSDHATAWHLSGCDGAGQPFVMGIYPMLPDESCFFLAIDLDGSGWCEDAKVVSEVVGNLALPVALERSRSGQGAHLWLFFDVAIPAALARRLGAYILSEAMERRPGIGLASYDRMFPNQDTLPKGGLGNLIALPLQKAARVHGNSVFLDQDLNPLKDQWAFLSKLDRIAAERVNRVVDRADKENRVLPVRMVPSDEFALEPWQDRPSRRTKDPPIEDPLPERLQIVQCDKLYIPKAELPPPLLNRIIRLAAFQNPEFYRAQAMRLPTYDQPRVIGCAEDCPRHVALPRGCFDDLRQLLNRYRVRVELYDRRQRGRPIRVTFRGGLRPAQSVAAKALLPHETGVLAATTAFGKTVLAAWFIARRGVNTLVLVHRQQLMDQWVGCLSAFLGLPKASIGCLGAGRKKLGGEIDVALIQSLVRKDVVDDRVADYGQIIIDECHHLSARSFELAVSRAKARYVLGLSATIERKDGHHPIIFMQCGPVRHHVDALTQAKERPFQHQVIVRPTQFRQVGAPIADTRIEYQRLCGELVQDRGRNRQIAADVAASFAERRTPIVLTERVEHISLLEEELQLIDIPCVSLRGGMTPRLRAAAMERLEHLSQSPAVLLATGRFIGEGFDCPQLDTLFVTLPVSWRGTIVQYVGRLHRLHANKRIVQVYDYVDLSVPVFGRMFDRRCAGYESVGYKILLPASALPGWPQSVPLPVDPIWKRDYSASVKRLLLDGVDDSLAGKFVRAASPDTDRGRARSASEAFLFSRLESLPATRGIFQLNSDLPIPFNQLGTMEVDFLCEPLKMVIELDGLQHLADEEAWRSDRRKDLLLQRNGYLVMRLLAPDITRNLEPTLDAILSTLACLRRQPERSTANLRLPGSRST